MNFTSLTFLIFLTIVFALYWLFPQRRAQNLLLLITSYVFYGWWDYRFCGLMFASSLIDYAAGLGIASATSPFRRRVWLSCSVAMNLGMLATFKYFNFFTESFAALAATLGWQVDPFTIQVILPVGISFYTFQTMSYTIDVYRGELKACRSLIDFCAFVSFFPQLVAGPLERASNLLPQFERERRFDEKLATDGLRLMLWGFFKNLVLADGLAPIVNARFNDIPASSGPQLLLATICFAFQIYCDFSAYSDIAIGTARQFGITLMRNFNHPYCAASLSDFWRRWHISLSTWLRDYVYFPLGGSRGTALQCTTAILLTFLISGFWHGAAWHFVAWGLLHGIATAATRGRTLRLPWLSSRWDWLSHAVAVGLTFSFVCLSWILFRAATLADARTILTKIAFKSFRSREWLDLPGDLGNQSRVTLVVLGLFILSEWFLRKYEHPIQLARLPLPVRWAAYTLLIWGTLELMPLTSNSDFIYFQF